MKLFNYLFAYPGQHFTRVQVAFWLMGFPALVFFIIDQIQKIIMGGR